MSYREAIESAPTREFISLDTIKKPEIYPNGLREFVGPCLPLPCHLVRDLLQGIHFMPIIVVEGLGRHSIFIGNNRFLATREAGLTSIEADVHHTDMERAEAYYLARGLDDGASARAEPGYCKWFPARRCAECANFANGCLAWEKIRAPEGWKPSDSAPRRCQAFVPMGSCLAVGAPDRYQRFTIRPKLGKPVEAYHAGGLTLREIAEKYHAASKIEISPDVDDLPH